MARGSMPSTRPRCGIPGVIAVVRDGSFLGVIAEREENAIKARAGPSGQAQRAGGTELPDPTRLFAHLKALPSTMTSSRHPDAGACEPIAHRRGDLHQSPYMAHASNRSILRRRRGARRPS